MKLTEINHIKSLLRAKGFNFTKSLGQNFLIAQWVPNEIAEAAALDELCAVLEIGPGIGCLTEQLSKRAGKVISVEADKNLAPILAETLTACANVELIYADIMKLDLYRLVSERFDGLRPVVCANLPYGITTPVLTKLIESDCFESITVMIQKEAAQRICAPCGSEDYGVLGILANWKYSPFILFDVPASCFLPQPKVTSSVLRLRRRSDAAVPVENERLMFRIIRAAFAQRRKTLLNALASSLSELNKNELHNLLIELGINPKIRGEMLEISDFAKIADKISGIMSINL